MKAAMQNLLSLPLFKGLASDELDTILGKVNALVKHFEKSDYIYLAGDAVESIGIVVAGTVQMIKEDIMGDKSIITTMGSGSIFAENFLGHDKQDEKTNVSYFAASDSEVLMVPFGKVLTDLSNNDPCRNKLLTNMISIMASNNAQLIEKTEILCKKTLRGKIMTYLEQEAKRNGSTEFEIPFNRTDMANYLDADRSALTRELARMKDCGLIMHLYYNKILLFYYLTAKKPKPCMVSAFAPFITNFKNIVLPGQHHFAFTIAIM